MINIKYFVEGQHYLETEIPTEFVKNGYFVLNPRKGYTLKVCGIILSKDISYIFYPKGYTINEDDERNLYVGKLLFKVLNKYKNSINLNSEEEDWLGVENKNIIYLNTIQWIINDYLSNGLFSLSEKRYEINGNGKVNWDKTIKSELPFVRKNKFIYLNLIINQNANANSIISKIHEKIVLEIINKFGWFMDINIPDRESLLHLTKDQEIFLLEKELKETFKSREIKLIQNLIIYLKDTEKIGSTVVLLTPFFYNIWEEMLKSAFNHDDKLSEETPRPYWKLNNSSNRIYTRQIPDILISEGDTLYIIDAKYYSILSRNIKKFPGWESIVKQIYYNLSLNQIGFSSIRNIFIMPATLNLKKYEYLGYSSVENKETELGLVLAYSLDIEFVFKSYVIGKRLITLLEEITTSSQIESKKIKKILSNS